MSHIYIAALATGVLFCLIAHIRRSPSSFYLGSGHYGSWIYAISIVAAFTGGGALINTTMLASQYGYYAFFDVFPAVLGLAISTVLVATGFFGKNFSQNFFDIKSDIYDRRATSIHYAQVAFLYVIVMAAQLRAVATIAEQSNISSILAIFFCIVTVAVYAFRGFSAVTRTDVAQLALMLPLYIILAFVAFEPNELPTSNSAPEQSNMPISLIIALSLPLFFLPISQEIHQRAAAVSTDKNIAYSFLLVPARCPRVYGTRINARRRIFEDANSKFFRYYCW